MRGKGPRSARFFAHSGITPACAGKSSDIDAVREEFLDHPRVCGEKSNIGARRQTSPGSPPRVRGKAFAPAPTIDMMGITPACAGKSMQGQSAQANQKDHPRVCGEKARTLIVQNEPQGSPPRMRGKVPPLSVFLSASGITPAYAGKSCLLLCLHPFFWDHPRVCGEKFCSSSLVRSLTGSPPRMRGKAKGPLGLLRAAGITPAYAGKSSVSSSSVHRSRDHPRVCGEKMTAYPCLHR